MQELITLNNITHQYQNETILQDLNLTVSEHQSIAFTGHNGCGKSTLLKIIAGLIRSTQGSIRYYRDPPFHYVPERFPKMNLTARQYLSRMGKLDSLDAGEVCRQIKKLSADFFLSEMLDLPMKHLSKGTLQKVSVIQALMKRPDVLLLDEPLSGQDTDSQNVFIEKVNELRRQGTVLIMSCHEQYLMDSISDTVYKIDNKQLFRLDDKKSSGGRHYILWFEKGRESRLPENCSGRMTSCGDRYKMEVQENESNQLIACMIQEGWLLRGMEDADHQ